MSDGRGAEGRGAGVEAGGLCFRGVEMRVFKEASETSTYCMTARTRFKTPHAVSF